MGDEGEVLVARVVAAGSDDVALLCLSTEMTGE